MRKLLLVIFVFVLSVSVISQTPASAERVVQVDENTVKSVLTASDGKPRLVNFWATWCTPCVEEFPILVKLDKEFDGKVDVVTISLDDPVERTRSVLEFLEEQNAKLDAYLLYAPEEYSLFARQFVVEEPLLELQIDPVVEGQGQSSSAYW